MALFDHIDWHAIQERKRRAPWYQPILEATLARASRLSSVVAEVPPEPGGWMHQYVCPVHWEPLIYEPSADGGFRCPHGDALDSADVRAAWRAIRHRELADSARDLAVAARICHDPAFARAAGNILLRYAQLYGGFSAHESAQPWMLTGRAFHQALTEALWAIPLAHATDLLEPMLSVEELDTIREALLRPISETLSAAQAKLVAQDRVASNYTAWLNTALGCLGFLLSDSRLIEQAIYGPGGFLAHMSAAIRPDGMEYEGSPYYHNFVTLAYTLLAEAALANGIDLLSHVAQGGASLRQMWDALIALAYPDGSIPWLNDGAYWRGGPFDEEICQVYEIALARTGDPRYAWLLNRAYQRRGTARQGWAAVLYAHQGIADASTPHLETTVLPHSGIATLRRAGSRVAATVTFGPDGGSHTHRDRLGLTIWPWSLDAGTPPYGLPSRREWYQQTMAHNAVVIDGRSQDKTTTPCRVFAMSPDQIIVGSRTLYAGVRLVRRIHLREAAIEDEILVSTRGPRTVDWVAHTDTGWRLDGVSPAEGAEPLAWESVGGYVGPISSAETHTEITATTESAGRAYELKLRSDRPFRVLLASCPGPAQAPSRRRQALIARCEARRARFHATYREVRHA